MARRVVRHVPGLSRVERVQARGGRIAHLDLTIVCEAPKIGPHRDAMRDNIARLAGIDASGASR